MRQLLSLMLLLVLALSGCSEVQKAAQKVEATLYRPDVGDDHLVFTSFRHTEERHMYLLYSRNGYAWRSLGPVLRVTEGGLRDPAIARGPDGTFHAVWTAGRRRIGYASSPDLVSWSEPRLIDLMASVPECRNSWAPELFYDAKAGEWLALFSSTVEGRFPGTRGGDGWNNRIYACTTDDFRRFSEPFLFFDPGYSVIDAALIKHNGRYLLFYKNEAVHVLHDGTRAYNDTVEFASGPSPRGPWTDVRRTIPRQGIEGPSPIEIDGRLFVYYDEFNAGRYGAMVTDDLTRWTDRANAMTIPEGHRHGTVLRICPAVTESLLARVDGSAAREQAAPQ